MRRHEVMVVVHRGGLEFLILLRSRDRGGYWNLPAGGVEEGETATEAAARELAEETGLSTRVKELALELGYEKPWGRVRLDAFAAKAEPGWEPALNEEHVEYRWCSEEDAVRLLSYREPREAVRAVARQLGVHA